MATLISIILDLLIFLFFILNVFFLYLFGDLWFISLKGEEVGLAGIGGYLIPVFLFGGILIFLLICKLRFSFSLRETLKFLPKVFVYSVFSNILLLFLSFLIAFVASRLEVLK